ncbi:MAG TPA: hypothetical protein VJQ82_02675 [Terriglobales bacterium]|nr:hypothetical protein [Terriglobales bacterium]
MAKLEDILKAQGWTDEDLAAQATVLNDPKLRAGLETAYSGMETTLESFKTENASWAKWKEDTTPLMELLEKDRTDARAEAASLRERLKLAEENGFAPRRDDPAPAAVNPQPSAFDPKAHKLVTEDQLRDGYAKFADMEGDAIAMANDLALEYHELTGKSLLEYSATDSEGRTLRGMRALRREALAAKQPLDKFVAQKFDFAGKRAAQESVRQKAAEDAIRADERSKVAAQYGDPNVRPLMPSANPFLPKPPAGSDGKPQMPWDRPAQERRSERLTRFMQTQAKESIQ